MISTTRSGWPTWRRAVDRILAAIAAQGAHRHPRRLRRRRRHLDRHPAPRARAARRRRRALHSRAAARRLRPAAGHDRSPARRRRAAGHLGGLRHPRAPKRRRARASSASISSSPTITSPTPSCRTRCAVINPKRHDCTLSRQEPRRRRRGAEAGAGAVRPHRTLEPGCRRSSRSPRSARWPTSCRSSARTASSPSSGSACCRRGRTRSACARCSTSAA